MKPRFSLSKILCVMVLSVINNTIWAGNNNYYAQVSATAIGPSGAGTVYASSNGQNGNTGTTSTAVGYTNNNKGNVSFTFQATPSSEDQYDFKGWSETNDVNTNNILSTTSSYTRNYQASNNKGQNNVKSYNIYAIFVEKPLFYFSATATAPNGGGTASVSPTTKSARGERWNSTSATTTVTFTATASSGYEFVGWYSDAGLTTQVSTSPSYQTTITSTSKDSNSPTNTTLYARFELIPTFYFSATAVASPSGGGTATASPATTSVLGAHWNSTSATTTAITFTTTVNTSYHFLGWSPTDNGAIENTNSSFNPTLTSNSKISGSPTNTTYYARFQPYATSITPTSSEITVYVGQAPQTITYSVSPAGAYDEHTTYQSDDTGIAEVDASGVVTGVTTGTTTITIKSLKDDNSTVAASATVTVHVKNKVATPVISFETGDNGATATITCATTGNKIYYTKNGGTPTTSSTEYTSPISVEEGDVIKAIAVKDPVDANWEDSDMATETCSLCTTDAPVITFNGSSSTGKATVTITANTGEAIYYTKGTSTPDDPTPTSYDGTGTNTVTIYDVAFGTIIKARAKSSSCQLSAVVMKEIAGYSYVDGGTVLLDDREDHNWTYYKGVDSSVDNGNYNTNYIGKLYSPNPRNVKITYKGVNGITSSSTTVKVSRNDPETSFVYYKTLEEGSTSGQYPYQVISNPFSVRPSTGTGNSKVYYGFAGWKITKGYQYIKRANGNMATENAVLNLDEKISFVNLPYPSVNCTSAEIEFETTWTQANVQSGNNITTMLNSLPTSGTYETNFAVLTGAYTTAWTGNKNVTVTSVYPDGSSDTRSNNNYTRLNVTVNSNYTVKYEYININNDNSTLSMGSGTKTLYIGRGVSNSTANGVVCNEIQGYNGSINSGGLGYTLKIESGVYNYLSFIKGYDGARTDNTVSGTVSVKGVLGCDYDRAKGVNTNLKIQQQIFMGYANNTALLSNSTAGQEVLNVTLKSGSLNSSMTSAGTADAKESFYIGIAGQYSPGYRVFTMEGGEMWNLAAGLCQNTSTTNSVRFRIKGGLIKGSIYGSAANANSYGYKQMIITGGTIRGWIAGGGNGTSANGGTTTGSSYIYVGGNARVDSQGSNTKINSSLGGQVFGSGSGVENTTTWGEMLYGSNVVIADNAYIERNVFGGGNFGWTDQYATIYLTGDKMSVGNVYGGANQNKGDNVKIYMTGGNVREGLYGGSNTTGTINYNVEMHINGGQIGSTTKTANIHGGGYGSPTRVSGNVDLTLGTKNQTTPGVTVYGDVYGGSALGYVNGTTAADTYHTHVTLNKGIINGSLYGGGLGASGTAANVYGPVQVKVYGGSVRKTDANGANGSGGVYGANNINGAPQRSVTVDIYGTDGAPAEDEYALFAVYGGGNKANYSYTNNNVSYPKVTVHNCDNSIEYVYGGGNAANVAATDVKIYGGNKIGYVFGGGNGTVTAANVTGNTSVNIYGGTIGSVFGGSNSKGTIGGTIIVSVAKQGDTDPDGSTTACSMIIKELYGGGNEANSNAGNITIGCTGDLTDAHSSSPGNIGITLEGIGTVYGGANQANIGTAQTASPITLTINSGIVANVYGGNNTSGDIYGTIIVNINKTSDACGWYVGNVFGGGNQAVYDAPSESQNYPQVNILNGDVSGDVFGGGYGNASDATKGVVNGNPRVVINGANASVAGGVYGGGSLAPTNGDPLVTLTNGATANIYGGGKAANVNGAPTVNINGGTVSTGVFGGCNTSGTVSGAIAVNINGGTVGTSSSSKAYGVFGGGKGSATRTGDAVTVTIGNENGLTPTIYGDVYGGSAEGNVNDDLSEITKVDLKKGTVDGSIYGGGFGDEGANALVNGSVQVVIGGGSVTGKVFGCNNANGTPKGTVSVTVNATENHQDAVYYTQAECDEYNTTNNLQSGDEGFRTTSDVKTEAVYAISEVYGGGNLAHYDPTDDENSYPTVTINGCESSVKDVYGGGNAAAVPRTYVVINGGIIDRVFAGGNGESGTPANVGYKNTATTPTAGVDEYGPGTANAEIKGGTINEVFGGSNANGTIRASGQLNIARASGTGTCDLKITDLYGGGNHAAGAASAISIGCTGTNTGEGITNVYGGANAADVTGNISLTIEEGTINNVYGGNNETGSISGTITVTINKKTDACTWSVNNVFGGGNQAVYDAPSGSQNYPQVNILNGAVSGDVFGGGYGKEGDPTKGVVNGNPRVVINGANASVAGGVYGGGSLAPTNGDPLVTLTNGSTVKVFGGGKAAGITGAPTVNINGGSVTTGVYGGCDSSGDVSGNITVNINGGTLGVSGTPLTSGIFGGGYGSSTTTGGNVTVNVGNATAASAAATPTIYGDIYGGSALGTVNDAVADETTVNFNNGTIHGNVYGGGLGAATLLANGYIDTSKPKTEAVVNGTVHVNIGTSTQASNFVTIDGQVFGCNNLAGSPKGHVYVDVYRTAHTSANTYPSPEPATASAVTEEASTAFAIEAVYGGGNLAHYTTTTEGASTHVHIYNCNNTIRYVYGGGNAASSPATDVEIDGGRFNYIFGGGNGAGTGNPGADINGDAAVTLNGGIIYRAFGGSNTKGVISGTSGVSIPEVTTCTRLIHEIFGGGNEAPGGSVDMTIPCGTTGTGTIYAGANNADMGTQEAFEAGHPVLIKLTVEGGNFTQVFGGNNQGGIIWGDVELYLKGGTIGQAFGGNNLGGNVKGTIKVFVDDDESACPLVLTDVYGGGNEAPYTPALDANNATIESPQVYINHIKSGSKILGNVYGGGFGPGATVTANPKVVVGNLNTGNIKIASIAGDVYGGGNQAEVIGNTTVIIQKSNTVVQGSAFGGGNNAVITGKTELTMNDGTVDKLFGGGNSAGVNKNSSGNLGSTKVQMNGGNVTSGIYGGSNSTGTVSGDITVNIYSGNVGDNQHASNVFGGGYGQNTSAGGNIEVAIGDIENNTTPTIWGDVYGGSAQGSVANTTVSLWTGTVNNVYGGGLGTTGIAAAVNGNARVNVNGDDTHANGPGTCKINGSVFGANNTNGSPTGTVSVYVYNTAARTGQTYDLTAVYGGGQDAATSTATSVYIIGGKTANVFGGGLGSTASVTGATVSMTGGTAGIVYGGGSAADVNGNTSVTISGGTVSTDVFGGGKGQYTTVTGDVQVNIGAQDQTTGGATISGNVYGGSAMGAVNATKTTQNDVTTLSHTSDKITDVNVYIGTVNESVYGGGLGQVEGGNIVAHVYGKSTVNIGDATNTNAAPTIRGSVYGGSNKNGVSEDDVEVNVIRGSITGSTTANNVLTDGNVFGGGRGEPTLVKGSVIVNIGKETAQSSSTYVGYAQVAGNVYGGSALGNVNAYIDTNDNNTLKLTNGATTHVSLNGGTVTGSVFGGGLGQRTTIESNVYGAVTVTANGGKAANVFGANDLYGAPQSTVRVEINGTDEVVANAYAISKVYGGGNLAAYGGTPTIEMTGGKVEYIYGGGYGESASVAGTSVTMANKSGTTTGGTANYIFGGGEEAPVTGSVTVNINGGTVTHDVYGGGALANTNIANVSSGYGTANPTIGATNANTTTVNLTGGKVMGNVYGGGLGRKDDPDSKPDVEAMVYGDVQVELNKTAGNNAIVVGSIFGANNINGTPKGDILVHVYSTENIDPNYQKNGSWTITERESHANHVFDVTGVYGGGNKADYIPKSLNAPKVIIEGCGETTIGGVYGGGNAAAVPATSVEIRSAYLIEYVFGGGCGSDENSTGANVGYRTFPTYPFNGDKTGYKYGTGVTEVMLLGGYIINAFGGSDTRGEIVEESSVNISDNDNGCPLLIGAAYGGGRKAPTNGDINFIIDCQPNKINTIYGGSEQADISGDVNLYIMGGSFDDVFGGNKKGGNIGGNITVNIQETEEGCKPITIGNLYGGCFEAPFSGNITVNLKSFTSIGKVYGGSMGNTATVTGNVVVNINVAKGYWAGKQYPKNSGTYMPDKIGEIGTVYGGGDHGIVVGNTTINIANAESITLPVFRYDSENKKYVIDTQATPITQPVLGAIITGNVYGGGNNADVTGNTEVLIGATKVSNNYSNVGLKESLGANYQGVKIQGSVYGGGNMGSVGTFTVNGAGTNDGVLDGKPVSCANNTGTSTVVIMDYAEIGPDNMRMITESGMPDDAGHVFGAGRGTVHFSDIQDRYTTAQLDNLSPQQKLDELAKIAYVNNTEVIIGSYAFVKGSVYGGSENGHVLNNTHVTIKENSQIGVGKNTTSRHPDEVWGENYVPQVDLECASWTYDANDPKPYDIYDYQTGTTKPKAATDGHTFYGNVFGGGSGYYPYASNPYYNDIDDYGYADGLWLRSAGIVEGNTVVDITGGHILTSVYGGNEQTDVLGSTTINMSDGTVGVPRTLAQMQAHPVTCYVFGGGKGDQRKNFNKWTNVGNANVNITGTARIYGSVFGGGEDGHVIGNALTNIGQVGADNSQILIGTTGTSAVDGNIFGGGRGFSGTALTAGVVQGNITVNIYGGTMLGSVFGGGRLASVGTNLVYPEAAVTEDSNGNVTAITNAAGNPLYGTLLDGTDHGNIYVNIYGGTIGATDNNGSLVASAYSIGDVFAGSKGNLTDPELGLANNTTLNISGGTINHNVYGGGEIASVGKITNFKQRDSKDNNNKYIYRHDFDPKANDGALYSFGLSWPYEFTYPSSGSGLATVSITGTTRIAGDVFGGSKGKVDVGENDITKQRFKEALYANVLTTDVTINLNATANSTDNNTSCIAGYVYGGSEDGHILDNTSVIISSGLIGGSVFGGGKGLGQYTTTLLDYTKNTPTLKSQEQIYSWTAGKVYGNTRVNMTGGHVMHNVYGGGYNGSVGKGNYAGGADDYYSNGYGELPLDNNANLWTLTEGLHDMAWHFLNSGKATVIVSGGTIGTESNAEADGFPYGNVFGSSRGKAAIAIPGQLSPRYRYIPEFYLGYANETEVEIGSNGSSNGPRIYGSVYGSGQDGHVRRDTKVTVYSGVIGNQYTNSADLTSKQWLHRGNIYGAGSGIGLDANNVQNYSSGSVTCATQVIIQGGTIYQNVYGGGALASVGPPKVPPQQYDESNAPTGSTKSYSYSKVTLNGGTIGTEAGYNAGYGGNVFGASRGSMPLNLNIADTRFATDLWTEVNISNGTVWGNVFGGGEAGEVKDGVTINIVGGQIKHDVYGGGALANTNTGNWGTNDFNSSFLTTNLGKTTTRYNTKVSLLGGQVEGDVYGGGLGRLESTGVSAVEAMVYGDVLVNLNGFDVRDFGTVPQILAAKAPTSITPNGTEHMIADDATGAIVNRIFGANNLNGTPAGHIKVHVFATQNSDAGKNTISDKFAKQPVQGEGQYKGETLEEFLVRLANANAGNNSMLNAITAAQAARAAYEIALSNYNAAIAEGSSATQEEKQNLHDILEDAQTAASEAIAAIYDLMPGLYDVKAVYGGGNLAAYIYGNGERLESPEDSDSDAEKEQKNAKIAAARTEVIIDGCDFTSIEKVYGGGNAAPVPGTYVLVNSSWEINELFGGGNGDDNYSIDGVWYENPGANVGYENYTHYVTTGSPQGSGTQQDPYKAIDNDNADTKEHRIQYYSYGSGIATTDIRGGTIHSVFGGSDKKGNIRNSALSVYTESNDDCPITINETYGGGKDAPMDADIEFNMDCVTDMDIVYGGANNADSYSDIRLNITNGHINSVYGGNNIGGALYGSITINIEEKGCTPIVIDNLYGGGNLAPYSIYGYEKESVNGVYVFKHDETTGKLIPLETTSTYGNDPVTSNDPRINIISATHIGNVYGGGYKAKLVGSPIINVNMQEGKMEVYKKTIEGDVVYVNVNDKDKDTGYETYNPVSELTETYVEEGVEKTKYFTQLSLGNIENIYGGGFEADVVGDTYVEIGTGQWITGWNINGAIYEPTKNTNTNYSSQDRHDAVITGNVFGGGDNADVTGNTNITIGSTGITSANQKLEIKHNVYGGGNMGSVGTITEQTKHSDETTEFALSWPYEFKYKEETGKATVNINGGRIGLSGKDSFGNLKKDDNGNLVYKADADGYLLGADGERIQLNNNYVTATDITNETTYNQVKDQLQTINKREDNGDVYGGSKGHAGGLKGEIAPDRYKEALIANVRETEVNINLPTPTDADIDILVSYDWEDEDNEDQMKYALKLKDGHYGIAGSVYGGGEDGHVYEDTHVNIDGGFIGHAVYGGGKGKGTYTGTLRRIEGNNHTQYETEVASIIAGKVYGNTNITMTNGYVMRNIFGGGNLGSVGKGNYASGSDDYYTSGYGEKINDNLWTTEAGSSATATHDKAWFFLNSGKTNVEITGGKVGFLMKDYTGIVYTDHTPVDKRTLGAVVNAYNDNYTTLPKKISYKDDLPTGNVFGGSRGTSAPDVGALSPRIEYVPEFYLGYVNETNVIIGGTSTSPTLLGSVYGGGQDGHVRRDAVVTINNGEIGIAYNETNRTLLGTLANNATTEQKADHADMENVQWLHRGNVYGAGSGIGKYKYDINNDGKYEKTVTTTLASGKVISETDYGSSAGSVSRFTTVNVGNGINGTTGHIIYSNVYGGGSLSSIGPAKIFQTYDPYLPSDTEHSTDYGKQTLNLVNIEGTVGHADSYAVGYGGDVNGGSRGESALDANTFATSFFTEVNIKSGAYVLGNVFGGGEAGLVKNDTYVNASGTIATTKMGNDVFGGGDKADVNGNTFVTINGGHIMHNVYGGGRMGSVGTVTNKILHNKPMASDYAIYEFGLSWPVEFRYKANTGKATVSIKGNTRLGTNGDDNGDVFGGGMGDITVNWTELKASERWSSMGSTDDERIINYLKSYRSYDEAEIANVKETDVTINLPFTGTIDSHIAPLNVEDNDGGKKYKLIIDANYNDNTDTYTVGNTPVITGSVYGGSENGHVNGDTKLHLVDGIIGHALYGGGKGKGTYQGRLYDINNSTPMTVKDYAALNTMISGMNNNEYSLYVADEHGVLGEQLYSITAGKVYGNTYVTMDNGYVLRNVFGGGNLGSVGKGNYAGGKDDYSNDGYGERPDTGADNDKQAYLWTSTSNYDPDQELSESNKPDFAWHFLNSGQTNIEINGGQVGYVLPELSGLTQENASKLAKKDDLPTGNVFGGSRGQASPSGRVSPRYMYIPDYFLGYVNQTSVTIGSSTGSGPSILGSVYGGGQDGHVRRDASVTVNNASIGIPLSDTRYTTILESNKEDLQWRGRGNVFGAGSGIGTYSAWEKDQNGNYTYVAKGLNFSSGSVTNNTTVTINADAVIYQNVYGGGSLASVGPPDMGQGYEQQVPETTFSTSKSSSSNNVIINGGTIGHAGSYALGYGGSVFGASRGNINNLNLGATPFFFATSIWTNVKANSGHILGNVFGGGENGEVKRDTYVEIGGMPATRPRLAPTNSSNNNEEPENSSPAPQRQDNAQPQNSVNGATQGNVATESLQNRTINTNRAGQ